MNKKLISILLVFVLAFSFVGCSDQYKDADIDPESVLFNDEIFSTLTPETLEAQGGYQKTDMVSLVYYNKDIEYIGQPGSVSYAFNTSNDMLYFAGYVPGSGADEDLFGVVFDKIAEQYGDFTAMENSNPIETQGCKTSSEVLKKLIGKSEGYFQFTWDTGKEGRTIEITYLTGTFSVMSKNKAAE